MKKITMALYACLTLLLSVGACRSESMWSEREEHALRKRGPDRAEGLLVYLRGVPSEMLEPPLSQPVRAIVRQTKFDVMGLAWQDHALAEGQAPALLRFVAEEIAEARRQGYRRIVLVGEGQRASLAIAAAASADVDGLLAIGPVGRSAGDLARLLSATRARHVGIVLFPGDDPSGDVKGGRARAFRHALGPTDRTLMLIEPEDIDGEQGRAPGRFTRRYRDCLIRIAVGKGLPEGEEEACDRYIGFAIGSDARRQRRFRLPEQPKCSDPRLAPFCRRWQGDDSRGAYLLLAPTQDDSAEGRLQFEQHMWLPPELLASERSFMSRVFCEPGDGVMTCRLPNATALLRVRNRWELEYLITYKDDSPPQKFLLAGERLSSPRSFNAYDRLIWPAPWTR